MDFFQSVPVHIRRTSLPPGTLKRRYLLMIFDDKLHEECGVFGAVVNNREASGLTYNALSALQHRGQEGAGIASLNGSAIFYHKDLGLVSEVFSKSVLSRLPESNMAIGHVRYSTTGANCVQNVQPVVTEYLRGRLATAHNGNIVNASAIKERLQSYGCDFAATNDTEVISSLIAYEALHTDSIEQAVINAVRQLRGAFSLVILSSKNKLIAVRDGFGMRPLCLGRSDHGVAVASESCALDSSNFQFERDVKPGEMIVIDADGSMKTSIVLEENRTAFCLFEYIYFARSDSEIDHLSVYQAHFNMGRQLAREFPVEADMVCGVPDSGLDAAAGYAFESGIPLGSGFTKNRYIGRSFIFPTQTQRDNAVRLKLNPLKANIRGKRLVVVDDSIVRGTTSARTVKMLRDAGASEVHMRISAPPFTHTCHFGTDIDDESKLIANRMSLEETAKFIGADSLGHISIEGIKQACSGCSLDLCTGCFDGNYPMEIGHHKKSEFEC